MAVKLSGIASIRVLAIVIFLIDVVVLAAVLLVLWNMAGEKNETCSKLCLPCADDKRRICCNCHVPTLQEFLTKVFDIDRPIFDYKFQIILLKVFRA